MSTVSAVRRYERGSGQERETASVSYLELSGFVRVYASEGPGQMEREVESFPAKTIEIARVVFGGEHARLIGSGWRMTGDDVKKLGADDDAGSQSGPGH